MVRTSLCLIGAEILGISRSKCREEVVQVWRVDVTGIVVYILLVFGGLPHERQPVSTQHNKDHGRLKSTCAKLVQRVCCRIASVLMKVVRGNNEGNPGPGRSRSVRRRNLLLALEYRQSHLESSHRSVDADWIINIRLTIHRQHVDTYLTGV